MKTKNTKAESPTTTSPLAQRTEQDIIAQAVGEYLEYRKKEAQKDEIRNKIEELQADLRILESGWMFIPKWEQELKSKIENVIKYSENVDVATQPEENPTNEH